MKTEADVQVLPADYAAKLFSRIIVRKFAVEVDCARQQKRAKKEIHASAKHSVVVQRASQGALGERFPSIAENSVVEVGVRTSFIPSSGTAGAHQGRASSPTSRSENRFTTVSDRLAIGNRGEPVGVEASTLSQRIGHTDTLAPTLSRSRVGLDCGSVDCTSKESSLSNNTSKEQRRFCRHRPFEEDEVDVDPTHQHLTLSYSYPAAEREEDCSLKSVPEHMFTLDCFEIIHPKPVTFTSLFEWLKLPFVEAAELKRRVEAVGPESPLWVALPMLTGGEADKSEKSSEPAEGGPEEDATRKQGTLDMFHENICTLCYRRAMLWTNAMTKHLHRGNAAS